MVAVVILWGQVPPLGWLSFCRLAPLCCRTGVQPCLASRRCRNLGAHGTVAPPSPSQPLALRWGLLSSLCS